MKPAIKTLFGSVRGATRPNLERGRRVSRSALDSRADDLTSLRYLQYALGKESSRSYLDVPRQGSIFSRSTGSVLRPCPQWASKPKPYYYDRYYYYLDGDSTPPFNPGQRAEAAREFDAGKTT
jgi:hypothetical protein